MNSLRSFAVRVLPPGIKRRIKKVLPKANSLSAPNVNESSQVSVAMKKTKAVSTKLVSVVIPVYNVEDYLEECLDSILAQTYRNLQIIVVDDGSTDNSLETVRTVAKRDKRIKVVTKANAGLGAARNTGVEHATGTYLVFADSDDVVPSNAYELMVSSLEKSGSDFATGSLYRFSRLQRETPVWCKTLHATDQIGITISDYCAGLVNVYAWNKMYRRTFWNRLSMQYPEGVRYEDQEPSTKMFLLAEKFDVLKAEVYGYRLRDDQSSITQNKHLVKDIEDRIKVIRSTAGIIVDFGIPEIRQSWVEKLIRYDVMPYIRAGLGGDRTYRDCVYELCELVFNLAKSNGYGEAPVKVRAAISAVLSDAWSGLSESILFNDETGAHLPSRIIEEDLVLHAPVVELISDEYRLFGTLLSLEESKIVAVANEILGDSSDEILVRGAAFIKTLDIECQQESTQIRAWAVNVESGVRVPARVERERNGWATSWSQAKWCNYDGSGFTVRLSMLALRSALGAAYSARNSSTWQLFFEISHGGLSRNGYMDRIVGGSFASVQGSELNFGSRDVTWQIRDDRLEFSIISSDVKLAVRDSDNQGIILEATGPMASSISKARLVRRGRTIPVPTQRISGVGGCLLALPSHRLSSSGHESWNLELLTTEKRFLSASIESGSAMGIFVSGDLELASSGRNRVQLTTNAPILSVTSFGIESNRLVIRGFCNSVDRNSSAGTLYFESGLHRSAEAHISWRGKIFEAQIDFSTGSEGGIRLPFQGYSLKHVDIDGIQRSVRLDDSSFVGLLPLELISDYYRVRLSVTKFGNTWINLSTPLSDNEYGEWNQKRLQKSYRQNDSRIDSRKVLFNAYLGERVTDSGKQIVQDILSSDLDLELYWTVATPAVSVPLGVKKVVQNTEAWYKLLAQAGTIFHNIYFDPWFVKRPDQRFIQTWHGTPLKTIGHTYWNQIGRSAAWVDRMDTQARSWTHLLSPSQYNSEIVARESGFTGELLELGYPRNDILARPVEADEVRKATRELLGIEDDKTVVLYAPTWRDSLSSQSWKAEMVNFLDLKNFEKQLGRDFFTLVRGHGHNERFGSKIVESERVKDVTSYPEINDLYLAADIIVTDYSSVMFDAVVANKPIVFFVPDLDIYMNSGRGMYVDLRRIAPGPVIFNQHELAEIVSDENSLKTIVEDERYIKFVSEYAYNDDGYAGRRIVSSLWPEANFF